MRGERKTERLRGYLKRAIDLYLVENADILGNIFVEDVVLSNDFKTAKTILNSDGKIKKERILKTLNENKREIYFAIKKYCKLKYYPALKFLIVTNDKMDF